MNFLDTIQQLFTDPVGAWDQFKNGATNINNKAIADENLEYQKERNEIEDARYEDETAYNRAFAEDERAYNRAFAENQRDYERALQQQIFEREDTAIERQANQLSKLGVNPLAQQLNGLGAGSVVSAGSPSASVSPSASGRVGSALHNDFTMQDKGLMDSIAPIMSFANSISNLNSQGIQRDKLREEVDYQRLKNQEQQIINDNLSKKLESEQEAREESNRFNKSNNPNVELNTKATAERNQRENVFQEKYGALDNSPREVRWATEMAHQADRAVQYTQDKVGDLSKSATSALASRAQKAINSYNQAMKKADNWVTDKWNKTKSWFKKNSAPAEHLRDMYGY